MEWEKSQHGDAHVISTMKYEETDVILNHGNL